MVSIDKGVVSPGLSKIDNTRMLVRQKGKRATVVEQERPGSNDTIFNCCQAGLDRDAEQYPPQSDSCSTPFLLVPGTKFGIQTSFTSESIDGTVPLAFSCCTRSCSGGRREAVPAFPAKVFPARSPVFMPLNGAPCPANGPARS